MAADTIASHRLYQPARSIRVQFEVKPVSAAWVQIFPWRFGSAFGPNKVQRNNSLQFLAADFSNLLVRVKVGRLR